MAAELFAEKLFYVRFNEVDMYNIVWNGSYAAYFEIGRQEFGNRFNLDIEGLLKEGIYLPLTHYSIAFKKFLRYNDEAVVRTTLIPTNLTKLVFNYTITRLSDQLLICTGTTEQVVLNSEQKLCIDFPPRLRAWRRSLGLES